MSATRGKEFDVGDRGRTRLERRYRVWLRLYPSEYRREREEEILQTLLELSRRGQRRPAPREVAALVLEGLRVRARSTGAVTPRQLWLAALPLTACLVLVGNIASVVLILPSAASASASARNLALVAWPAVPALLALAAVHRHRNRLAILLATLPALVDVQRILSGALEAAPGSHAAVAILDVGEQLLPALLLLPLLLSSERTPAPRPWQTGLPALVAMPALVAALAVRPPFDTSPQSERVLLILAPVLLVLALGALLVWGALVDARVALAVSLFIVVKDATFVANSGAVGLGSVPWTAAAIMGGTGLAFLAAGGYRAHRQAVR